jgi:heme ABC exporter ATP-binding subunit CcmA
MGLIVRFRSAVSLLGRFPALAGVDLDVAVGEVVLVHGPNGAGKTTLLRACAGLVAIGAGEVEVLGHDLRAERRAVRRRVGLVGHASCLYDDLTVADNLRFAARAAGRPAAAAEAAMGRLGLDGRLREVAVARLSAGQRRRTALAAAVARQPELWLLDEPHAGLDAAGRDLLDALVGEAVTAGATVVLASHELDRARRLATRQVGMAGGRVTGGLLPADGEVPDPAGPAPPPDRPEERAGADRTSPDRTTIVA